MTFFLVPEAQRVVMVSEQSRNLRASVRRAMLRQGSRVIDVSTMPPLTRSCVKVQSCEVMEWSGGTASTQRLTFRAFANVRARKAILIVIRPCELGRSKSNNFDLFSSVI